MEFKLIAGYLERRVPRYTSYPTAPHFSATVDTATYRGWLAALPASARLSLYLHVPFCHSLCWYCGCHTKVATRRAPIDRYVRNLRAETALVAGLLGSPPRRVVHVHWGGGTPTIVGPEAFAAVMTDLRERFMLEPGAEIAVEIDPRRLDAGTAAALARNGVTRASLGVQSFDPAVQHAVNRVQSLDASRAAADLLRANGIAAINIDLLYGLPHETVASCRETAAAALTLIPARVAAFGYAHVPHMKRHQRLLDEKALPSPEARYRQEEAIAEVLTAAGYRRIGLDHYARPDDALARAQAAHKLRRNFQGYTDDPGDALIGLGASSIGELPQGYVQNLADLPQWSARIEAGELATARGFALSAEDRLRREIIERLMCDLAVDVDAVARRHGFVGDAMDEALVRLRPMTAHGLVDLRAPRVSVPEPARPLLRCVASAFDAYLEPARHSVAV